MYREKQYPALNGITALLVLLTVIVVGLILAARQFQQPGHEGMGVSALLVVVFAGMALGGLFMVQPNEAKALTLFGTYKGTVKRDGVWWANPFLAKRPISLRVRNFETAKLKVNDNHSNPIEIGAIIVWKVVDSAEALFEVEDYTRYVAVQSESALRAVATQYPYDSHTDGGLSLSTHTTEVSQALEKALVERLLKAGVEVVEARISHLAYAQEIEYLLREALQRAGRVPKK